MAALLSNIEPIDLQRVVNKQDSSGRSPLLMAAKHGHTDCVLLLLKL